MTIDLARLRLAARRPPRLSLEHLAQRLRDAPARCAERGHDARQHPDEEGQEQALYEDRVGDDEPRERPERGVPTARRSARKLSKRSTSV